MIKLYLPIRFTILLLGCYVISHSAKSQQMLGISTDNYNGIYSLFHNPASIADSPYSFQFNGIMLNYSANPNFISDLKLWGPMYPLRKHYQTEELYDASRTNGSIAPLNDLNINGQIIGPSLMIKLGYYSTLAVTTRVRGLIYGSNVPEAFTSAFSGAIPQGLGNGLSEDPFFLNSHLFSETGLTYSRSVLETEKHFLKAGVTVKNVNGLRFSLLEVDGMDYDVSQDRMLVNELDYSYASSGAVLENMSITQLFLGNNLSPSALASDFGFVYEFRPRREELSYYMNGKMRTDPTQPAYLLRLGAGITDLGSITYNEGTRLYQGQAQGVELVQRDFQMLANNDEAFLRERLGMEGAPDSGPVPVQLPTSFNISADLRVSNTFYLNFMTWQALEQTNTVDIRGQSFMAVTPRLESRDATLALPVKFINDQVNVGLAFKIGPFILGTDNLGGMFNQQANNASNVYMGFNIFNRTKKQADKDGDGTSDKYDQCPDIPGLWEFQGCPDYDADGVEDKLDQCPMVAGLIEFGGCPDTDGDGLPDVSDRCPEDAGPVSLYGCPDRDGDQVPDAQDDCPFDAGLPGFYGCPDTDGDGIYDADDACPEVAGLSAFGGCPDTDGDGIPDADDACPELAGLLEMDGCPDTDGDGVADAEDRCPDVAGSANALGCPDRDDDGVPDKFDQCPDEYGDIRNEGCPRLTSYDEIRLSGTDQATLDEANARLSFTGSNGEQLASSSLETLNELAAYLIENPDYRLVVVELKEDEVQEADDGWGSFEELYKANAVADYLADQGIFLDRIVTQSMQLDQVPGNMKVNRESMVKMVVVR